jgi:hypothetical protein
MVLLRIKPPFLVAPCETAATRRCVLTHIIEAVVVLALKTISESSHKVAGDTHCSLRGVKLVVQLAP